MSSADEHLRRWREAGLIDEATAARIVDFEAVATPASDEADRPGVLEALLYLGVTVVAVGVVILVATVWSELEEWARLAVFVVPGLLALLAGQAMRSLPQPEMVRGGHVTWLVATALLAGAVAVWGENEDWEEGTVAIGTALAATILAVALWTVAPSHPQVVGMGSGMFALAMSVGAWPDEYDQLLAGGLCALFGAVAIVLVEAGALRPRTSARAVFALLVAWGTFFAGFGPEWAEVLAFIAAVALVALSVARGGLVYTLAGVGTGFAALIHTILEHVEDPTAAALALVFVGGLMVAVVIALTRRRPWRQAEAAS